MEMTMLRKHKYAVNMAEDARADAESHFVNGLNYLITLPYCGGRVIKNAFEMVSSLFSCCFFVRVWKHSFFDNVKFVSLR